MSTLLLGLALLTRFDGGAEATHELGTDDELRMTIALDLDLNVLVYDEVRFDIFTGTRTYVRSNHRDESPVRISPQQIHYPVGAAIRWPSEHPGWMWGVFALHQSNHDIDLTDEVQNRETVAYEIYGAEWLTPRWRLSGGVYYDRGTRLDGTRQTLPFDYYLGGARFEGDWPLVWRWYVAGAVELVGHREAEHDPPHLNVSGHLDAGLDHRVEGGRARTFLRFQRLEDYQHLADEPRHLLLFGIRLGSD